MGLSSVLACKVYDSSIFTDGSGGGGAGGGGGATLCSTPADCPGTDDECKKRACVGGFCSFDFAEKDKELTEQTPGDCQVVICDGQGNLQAVPTDDPPNDMLECTTDSCTQSVPNFETKATGTLCAQGKCNDVGACVECLQGSDCVSTVCDTSTFRCAPQSCGDTTKNGAETDVDCGGGECPTCGPGKGCTSNTDCAGQACSGAPGTCQESCKDKVVNNQETDVDCGGAKCGPCAIGQKCMTATDCSTNNCAGGTCFIDGLVINEVDYDQVMPDTTEFIEIYNGTGLAKNLAGLALVLVNGQGNTTYLSFDLSPGGTLAAGQYLVVGTTAVKPAAGAIKLTFANAQDNVQNGGNDSGLGDGIALIDTTTKTLIDALAYEGPLPMAPVTGLPAPVNLVEGTALPTSVADSNTATVSLCRLPDGRDTNNATNDWKVSSTPTPGAANKP